MIESPILFALGLLCLLALAIDSFLTIFGPIGGGPFTNFWMKGTWKLFLKVHKKRRIHNVLQMVGPVYLALIVMIWYLWMNIGWFLIFLSGKKTIINSSLGSASEPLERLYYIGSTLSTLGLGDHVPEGFPWTILSNSASFGATFLITISLSYVLPVISAANKRKELAEQLNALGEDPYEIIETCWARGRGEFANQQISTTIKTLNDLAHQHLLYPVLHYFHNADLMQASSRAVLSFSDAFFLISRAAANEDRPPLAAQKVFWSTLNTYRKIVSSKSRPEEAADLYSTEHLSRSRLEELGVRSVSQKEFDDALRNYEGLRKDLVSICMDDGWGRSLD